MTVALQALNPDQQGIFETLIENEAFLKKLGPLVQAAVESEGSDTLKRKIQDETVGLMGEFRGARIEDIVDQSFNRQISEAVDKAITRALEGRSGELQSAIEQIVTKAVDAKLNELKNKAPVRTQKRRGK
jgi:hypothetical protein